MSARYMIALDQGTTSSRAVIFDHEMNIIRVAQREYTQYYPKAGWVEHDPLQIYATQHSVLMDALLMSNLQPTDIAAIGITNQRETTVVWDRHTGRPVYNAIVWQCRRTAPLCKKLEQDGWGDYIRETTGLRIDAYFSATKLAWILDNVEGARARAEAGDLLFGTVDTWLMWKLSGGRIHATDYTNASRTMLLNIHTLDWDEKLLTLLNIPRCMLPRLMPSSGMFGMAQINGVSVPITGVAGDQQAALFGQCCWEEGQVKNTYGTGCFMLMNTGTRLVSSEHGLLTTIAASDTQEVHYALEGSVFTGGAVVQWLRDEMHLFSDAEDSDYFARKAPDTAGVYFVPAFTGLGAPYWDMYARGTIVGITRGTRREHVIRAAMESIAHSSADLLEAIAADTGVKVDKLVVDGGASRNGFLMQFQADMLRIPLVRPAIFEATALGAAALAGLASGYWTREEILAARRIDSAYQPEQSAEAVAKQRRRWKKAVQHALAWAEDEE